MFTMSTMFQCVINTEKNNNCDKNTGKISFATDIIEYGNIGTIL